MHSDITALLYNAEDHYLTPPEIIAFKHCVVSLTDRLETYKLIRDQEIAIFQPIANELSLTFANDQTELVERAIKDWLLIMRYGAMAMLLNNSEFLQRRLLEWLSDRVKAHQLEKIETQLYELLEEKLAKLLSPEQLVLIKPFLIQAKTTLLDVSHPSEIGVAL